MSKRRGSSLEDLFVSRIGLIIGFLLGVCTILLTGATTYNLPVTQSVCFNDVSVCLKYSTTAVITATVQIVDGSIGYIVATVGGSYTVAANSSGINLNPAANIGGAGFTVVFPVTPIEGQLVHITTTHNINPLVLSASQTINTPINTLNAGAHATYRFVLTGNYWVIDD